MTEPQLWMHIDSTLGPGNEVTDLYCERVSCVGALAFGRIAQARGLEAVVEVDGERLERLPRAIIVELGAILSSATGDAFALRCQCGALQWDARAQTFTSTAGTDTKEGDDDRHED